jgi:predicted RNase H-like nuclease
MGEAEMVIGIDARPKGWVAVALGDGDPVVASAGQLSELIDRFTEATVVAIDMPIGFSEGVRPCDLDARSFVGPRRNSVFMTPPEDVLYAPTYPEANALSRAKGLGGISKQAFALAVNVRRVAELVETDQRVIEVHPEVSFRALLGSDVPFAKTTWNGLALRRRALADAGITIPDRLEDAGSVPPADVLDAAAAAWSAQRYANGEAAALPAASRPGERPVIWY